MTLPNFIVVGPGKTGTTWLYKCLGEHPQVSMARHIKETIFFTDFYARGLSWYEKFFEGSDGAIAIGEVSNTYFVSPVAAARIAELLPQAKLIVILRDPLDRLISLYRFRRRNGSVRGTFEEAIAADPSMIADNFYDEHLARYLTFFPREQIFIALFDDLVADPHKLLRNVFKFLGVDAAYVPASADKPILTAMTPRHANSFRALKCCAVWLRRYDFNRPLNWAKTNPVLLRLLTRPFEKGASPAMAAGTRVRLRKIYGPHIAEVSAMLGRDLSGWI